MSGDTKFPEVPPVGGSRRRWSRIDHEMLLDTKLIAAGVDAVYLYVCAYTWTGANETYGFIPEAVAEHLSPLLTGRRLLLEIGKLQEAGLWVPKFNQDKSRWPDCGFIGYQIPGWRARNPTKKYFETKRKLASLGGRAKAKAAQEKGNIAQDEAKRSLEHSVEHSLYTSTKTSTTESKESTAPRTDVRGVEPSDPPAESSDGADPRFWVWLGTFPTQPSSAKVVRDEWDKVIAGGTEPEVLVSSLKRQAEGWRTSPEVVPSPEDWLRHHGWEWPTACPPAALVVVAPVKKASGHPAVALYCEAFKARYTKNPAMIGRAPAILKRVYDAIGEAEYEKAIENYFQTADEFVTRQRHPVGLIESQINRWREGGEGPGPKSSLARRTLQVLKDAQKIQEREQRTLTEEAGGR